jgi:DNA-3-methyladenine glycosylase
VTRLPQEFYRRDALDVARELLGHHLVHEDVTLRITEVEAYRYPNDSANHCRAGRTTRNAPMWGPPGHAYIYLCYGIHMMLNLVTNVEGEGAAVLIRACQPVEGESTITLRRGGKTGPVALTGPGKVAAALGLDRSFNHHPLYEAGGLEVREGVSPEHLLAGPRVGIGYAEHSDQHAPWRLAVAHSPWVSHPRTLQLVQAPIGNQGGPIA